MEGFSAVELIKMLIPYIVLEVCLKAFCLYRLSKDEVKYMPKFVWAIIILFFTTFGPLAYLFIGRKKY